VQGGARGVDSQTTTRLFSFYQKTLTLFCQKFAKRDASRKSQATRRSAYSARRDAWRGFANDNAFYRISTKKAD
jgi:hypothetical protein